MKRKENVESWNEVEWKFEWKEGVTKVEWKDLEKKKIKVEFQFEVMILSLKFEKV